VAWGGFVWQTFHEGPLHISVDGTIRNPYVLTAVVIVVLCAMALGYVSLTVRTVGARVLAWIALLLIFFESTWIYHRVAFELHSVVIHQRIATTFFGRPPEMMAPLASLVGFAAAFVRLKNGRGRSSGSNREART